MEIKYNILYHPDILKHDLLKMSGKVKQIIKFSIEERLMIDPMKFGQHLKRDLKGYKKLRVCDYRIIYKIVKKEVIILKIGHRRDVYQKVLNRID